MKIGLVLFGHLRSYRQTLASFNSLRETLQQSGDVDVFCHTWNIEESITGSWWKEHKPDNPPPATVSDRQIEESFSPVKYIIEPSRQFDDSGYNIKSSVPVVGILSMLHSQLQAFQLLQQYSKETGTEYDVVIKLRYDLVFEIATPFSSMIKNCITNNCLYLPTSNPYELGGSFSDVFVLGPARLVDEYFTFVPNFRNIVASYQQNGYKELLPELCLTRYLIERRVCISELVGLRIHILRLSGDKFQINTDRNFFENKPLCFFRDSILTNKKVLPEESKIIDDNISRLVKKYTSWANPDADKATLEQYVDLYKGMWIGVSKIKKLATKARKNSIFSPHVMKNYFEESLRNGKYGRGKKILLATILTAWSGYGFFFFRVLKNALFGKNEI